MPIATRLTNTGTLLVNGSFDEVTFSNSSPVIKNLIYYTETFELWGNSVNIVTPNVTTAPNGTLTADRIQVNNSGYTAILNNPTIAGVSYVFSFYVKSVSGATGTWPVNYYTGAHNRSTVPITGEWTRQYITFTGTGGLVNVYAADNRSLLATINDGYVWGAQLEVGTSPTVYQGITTANTLITPPFKTTTTNNSIYSTGEYDEVSYNTATPTIKNLFKYTETFFFDYTNWTLNSGRMTQNAVLAPDGRSLAPKLIEDTVTGQQRIYNWHAVTAGTTYTYSIFLKPAERYIIRCYFEDIQTGGGGRVGAYLNLQTGTIITPYVTGTNTLLGSNLQYVDNGWYRYSWTVQAQQNAALNSTAFVIFSMGLDSSTFSWTGDGTSGMYIWGAQKEISTAVTDYQGIGATTLIPPNFARRETQAGNMYVTDTFDEFTGAPVVDSSLTMWLDFGQTASYSGSGATVNDLSPTRTANVTLTGSPTFSSTDGGGSETFNGTSQYGTGSGAPLGSSAYTKSFWFQLSSYGVNNNVVSGATGQHFSYFSGGTRLLNGHSFWGNFGAFSSVTTFSLNTWYHAVVTFNTATGMALYVNGALDSTYVSTSGTSRTDTALTGNGRVDIAQFGGGNLLSGKIGQVMIYNRALTADEVATNFNALRGRYGI